MIVLLMICRVSKKSGSIRRRRYRGVRLVVVGGMLGRFVLGIEVKLLRIFWGRGRVRLG